MGLNNKHQSVYNILVQQRTDIRLYRSGLVGIQFFLIVSVIPTERLVYHLIYQHCTGQR